ncbi:MAG: GTPase ObgE [Bifidobacteriaceae bacterium]|jgi:GTP-binding protein|nr:GTPase ObgE [Bifidobacteriaceae bacterium]
MVSFVDTVRIFAKAGSGGNGSSSIKREKYRPLAGPDGGDGGNGASIILQADTSTSSLLNLHFQPHINGKDGKMGLGSFKNGESGKDIYIKVPPGTVVRDANSGETIADLVHGGEEIVVAKGGIGGLGNAALKSKVRKAPGFALLGEVGEEKVIELELKSIADVAFVGYPSSGKSSLIAALSAAKPKIADYPFTTLTPNLGIVMAGESRFAVADVPGLIEGASDGKGLGLDFLRHIERTKVILHIIDMAIIDSNRDPITDYEKIEHELSCYATLSGTIDTRPRVIALNKMDVTDTNEMFELVKVKLDNLDIPYFPISAATHEGLDALKYYLAKLVSKQREVETTDENERIVLRPKRQNNSTITVKKVDSYFLVTGDKPEKWIRQTDWTNDEAVGYLAERFMKAGVEEKLNKLGAVAGNEVRVGSGSNQMIFDWLPALDASANILTKRGSDIRMQSSKRLTRKEREMVSDEVS